MRRKVVGATAAQEVRAGISESARGDSGIRFPAVLQISAVL